MKRKIALIIIIMGTIIIANNTYCRPAPTTISGYVDGISFTGDYNKVYSTSWGLRGNLGIGLCQNFDADLTGGYVKYGFKDSPPPNVMWNTYGYDVGVGGTYFLYNRENNPCSWGMNPYARFIAGVYYYYDSQTWSYLGQSYKDSYSVKKLFINPSIGTTYNITEHINLDFYVGYKSIYTTPSKINYLEAGLGAGLGF